MFNYKNYFFQYIFFPQNPNGVNKLLLRPSNTLGLRQNAFQNQVSTVTMRKSMVAKHRKDGVPKDYELVFTNALSKILGPCRLASTALGALTVLTSSGSLLFYWPNMSTMDTVLLSVATLVTFPTVILVNFLSRRYFLRIYFNSKINTFVGINRNFIGSLNKITYSPLNIKAISSLKKDSYIDKSNIKIFGQTFHIKARDFILPKYYNMHTGCV